jgi:dTDP-4-amino-4,6-dideoxygalactose transaminase
MLRFNRPAFTGKEVAYIEEAIRSGHLAGDGTFSKRCQETLKQEFGFREVFLTPSCTAAMEMTTLLCDLHEGDEVVLPSFSHVGVANALVRSGAKLVFADSLPSHPNVDPESVAAAVGPKTRAVVAIHYAGMACNLPRLKEIAKTRELALIEDAAHALGAYHGDRSLGSWGDFAVVSFHETKNINCGLGGMLILNRSDLSDQAMSIWHQGTNRPAFERGETPFYTWVRTGGSFQLSELNAAFLYPQLLNLEEITSRRLNLWQLYYDRLKPLEARGHFRLPVVPENARHNGHIFYLLLESNSLRNQLIRYLHDSGFQAVFHYMPLHQTPLVSQNGRELQLPNCERIADTIVRLPLFDGLSAESVIKITDAIENWQKEF